MALLKNRPVWVILLLALLVSSTACQVMDRLSARDHLNKGVAAYKGQQYGEAAEQFKEAVRLDPELTAAQLYLATTYRAQWVPGIPSEDNLRRAELAIKTFEEVLADDPGNINAIANIAGIYSGMDEADKAKEWYHKRIELQPDNPEPYYGIATINYKLVNDDTGNSGENVENLEDERKVELQGLVDDGVANLQKALDLNPQYSDAMQYLNLLYRERSYLATDEEEKSKWEKEALKLAMQALELKRKQEEEAEKRRHSFGTTAKDH